MLHVADVVSTDEVDAAIQTFGASLPYADSMVSNYRAKHKKRHEVVR